MFVPLDASHLSLFHDLAASLTRELLARGTLAASGVLLQHRQPAAWSASVFVPPDLAGRLSSSAHPVEEFSAALFRSPRESVLDTEAIRQANTHGGLHLFSLLHRTTGDDLALEEAYLAHHRGYRLESILIPEASLRLHRQGLHGQPHPWAALLFLHRAPRWQFTTAEQDVLRLARTGLPDNSIAQRLFVSEETVKKRWVRIFARVADHSPDLLPQAGIAGRGAGKRGLLLASLRPEELCPLNPGRCQVA